MDRKFVFVSGCPRSGTTALTHLLNWSDEVFVGQERFALLLEREPSMFGPDLFTDKRMREFRAGDCGYTSFESNGEYGAWYANDKLGVDIAQYRNVGDKITRLYRSFERFRDPSWADHEVHVFHIARNILDVASSYQSRNLDQNDGWNHDYARAIVDWTESVEQTHQLLNHPIPGVALHLVDYDSIFTGDRSTLSERARQLFRLIGAEYGERQDAGITKIHEASAIRSRLRKTYGDLEESIVSKTPPDAMKKHRELVEASLTSK